MKKTESFCPLCDQMQEFICIDETNGFFACTVCGMMIEWDDMEIVIEDTDWLNPSN